MADFAPSLDGGDAVAATPERRVRREPLEEEREKARQAAEGSQLPSESGQGPGAGETPVADVEVDQDATDDVPSHPSLGKPPRRG
jgi:hypothetical protein